MSSEKTEVGYTNNHERKPDESLIGLVRLVAKLGVSYRDFRVGAVARVFLPGTGDTVLRAGWNNSPEKGAPKRCAEMHIMEQVKALTTPDSQPTILELYVAGPSDDIRGVNGVDAPTLHPCADCQRDMAQHPAFIDDTLIFTTGFDKLSPVECHTPPELAELYRDKIPPPLSRPVGRLALDSASAMV